MADIINSSLVPAVASAIPAISGADGLSDFSLVISLKAPVREKRNRIVSESVNSQIEAFGRERWQTHYVRLGDVKEAGNLLHEGKALQNDIWSMAQGRGFTAFKRFQELFCNPEDRIVPRFTTGTGNSVTFLAAVPLDPAACLVNPERIPDKLAVDLGLMSPADLKLPPLERLALKAVPAAIAQLKEIWSRSTPFQYGNHRILIVRPPARDPKEHLPLFAQAADPHEGLILAVRERAGTRGARTVQCLKNIYDAQRKSVHIRDSYQGEIDAVVAVKEEIRSLRNRLDRGWIKGVSEDQKAIFRKETTVLAEKVSDVLKNCVDLFKKDAHDSIMRSMTFRDAREKENITAVLSRMTSAVGKLERRLTEMSVKGGFNGRDEMAVSAAVVRHEQIFRSLRTGIAANAGVLDDPAVRLFGGGTLSAQQRLADARGIESALRIDREGLAGVNLKPFTDFRIPIMEEADRFERALTGRDREGAKESLLKIYLLAKFCAVEVCCRRIEGLVTEGGESGLIQARGLLENFKKLFKSHQVFPELHLPAYGEAYDELGSLLDKISLKIGVSLEHRDDPELLEDLNQQLKDYLHESGVAAMVRKVLFPV